MIKYTIHGKDGQYTAYVKGKLFIGTGYEVEEITEEQFQKEKSE